MNHKPKKRRSSSIMDRLLLLLLLVLLVQLGIYLLVFLKGGIIRETEENAFSIFQEQTANRKLYLENEMLRRWSNTSEGESDVLNTVQQILSEQGADISALQTDQELCQQVVSATAPDIIAMLRRNSVTGAFLVLDSANGEGGYPGFYVRDYDPVGFSEDNTDLLMERGLPSLARENGIPMDSYWSALFRFDDLSVEDSSYFFTPIQAANAVEVRSRKSKYFYHWSGSLQLNEMDREVITYSIPLIWKDGTVFGVLGMEVTTDYLADQLKYDELSEDRSGVYFLGVTEDGGENYRLVCTSGPSYQTYFGQDKVLTVQQGSDHDSARLSSASMEQGLKIYGAVNPIKLYNSNTPFEQEQWALIGIMDGDSLHSFSKHIQSIVLISALASLGLGLILVVLAARSMSLPIARLVATLKKSDPDQPIELKRLQLTEIDALTEAIENLSNAAVESAARSSKIINMTHIPIGTYEYQKDGERVFCSRNLFKILGWPVEDGEGDVYLDRKEFQNRMAQIQRNLYNEGEHIFRLPQKDGTDRWVQLFSREEAHIVLGAMQDITRDMESKRKIEYERDFDILTDLYNRRAFDKRLRSLFSPARREGLGVAALLMFDLDNLKYVNDTYGHDSGDRYIQAFGKSLEFFYRSRSIVGRRSGDEFNVFLYGYSSQEEIRTYIRDFWSYAGETTIPLSNGEQIKVRASGGLAWYPVDAENCDDLMRKADFAMYNIKHTVKGSVQEFDSKDYEEKSILIEGQDALNRLLDGKLVRYALQPIMSTKDGSIYGYEMLMRPQIEQLADLGQLFRLAKSQSKLLQMERLTWFEALDTFSRLDQSGQLSKDAHVFINSIGSQALAEDDLDFLELRHGDLLHRLVVEITEGEEASREATDLKKRRAFLWKAQVALDDFGTGFTSETVLITAAPDLVKVDISIIRDIDKDEDRLELLTNLVRYAKARGIRVLAEGVETREELETVVSCGVDYLQGYYIGRPVFTVCAVPYQIVDEVRSLQQKYWGTE